MEDIESESHQIIHIKSRNYICPCGKAYLSNAALFTHIKQKHQGKAPGQVSKPKTLYQKRGRPSNQIKNLKANEIKKNGLFYQSSDHKINSSLRSDSLQRFQQLFTILTQIQPYHQINPKLWTSVKAFPSIFNYLKNPQLRLAQFNKSFKYFGVRMGVGIAQFLRFIHPKVEKYQFEQVVVALVLLVQYIIDENNRDDILQQAPIEIIFQYVNEFINHQLNNVKQDFEIDSLWIMKRQNYIQLLFYFMNWLIYNNYASYQISLRKYN